MPAVLVPLGALPIVPEVLGAAGYTRAVRCVGEHGTIGHVFVRDEPDGYTAIGEHVVDVVEPNELDAQLARAEAELDEDLRAAYREGDDFTARRVVFTVFDDQRHEAAAARTGSSELAAKLGPPQFDGDLVPWRVVRERRGG